MTVDGQTPDDGAQSRALTMVRLVPLAPLSKAIWDQSGSVDGIGKVLLRESLD